MLSTQPQQAGKSYAQLSGESHSSPLSRSRMPEVRSLTSTNRSAGRPSRPRRAPSKGPDPLCLSIILTSCHASLPDDQPWCLAHITLALLLPPLQAASHSFTTRYNLCLTAVRAQGHRPTAQAAPAGCKEPRLMRPLALLHHHWQPCQLP